MKTFVKLSLVCSLVALLSTTGCQPTAGYTEKNPTVLLSSLRTSPVKKSKSLHLLMDKETSAMVAKGIDWLAKAQLENGAWGAGTHASQRVTDPHSVQSDPATTAFAAMALLRAGNTLESGKYQAQLEKALEFLLTTVESSDESSPNITSQTGTQPQVKLGQNIDVSMASRFFTRIMPLTENDPDLVVRVQKAQSKCISKIEKSQGEDGSIQGGTWAGVLQSAVATMALEEAADAGQEVDSLALARIKTYQSGNVDVKSGVVVTGKAAGVQLYALSSTNRSTAKEYKKAKKVIEEARREGKFRDKYAENEDIPVTAETLKDAGLGDDEANTVYNGYAANTIARERVQTNQVMSGFGNNGGEEFLSHMMTSESLVGIGGDEWNSWNKRMKDMMGGIQNGDGSWSGHHCITSPVFCTAAVILTLTVENDQTLIAE